MTKLHELSRLGQSVWLDYIRRAFITSGELQDLLETGITGVTSNPAIFEKAIAGSADYDRPLRELAADGKTTVEIYERLAIADIQGTADLLRPVYDRTRGLDGYVSLEVNPELAHDADGTVAEARRLAAALNRPNIMIKVPATKEGIRAIEALIGEGINVNVTLIFSQDHYDAAAGAYLRGLERLAENGGDLSQVASVASFFLSRIDSAVDLRLSSIGTAESESLRGRIAIASAKIAYQRYLSMFSGVRWEALAAGGAREQRLLWASTGTKNPIYPDTMYVDELIGPNTVNTIPPATLKAFLDHGRPAVTLTSSLAEAQAHVMLLSDLGIDLNEVTEELQREGVEKFVEPFSSLMKTIAGKAADLEAGRFAFSTQLGNYEEAVNHDLQAFKSQDIMRRIWDHDHTVWAGDPAEISNRLGWLNAPEVMVGQVDRIKALVGSLLEGDQQEGPYTDALLLGMGGSSLAPDVFGNTFGGAIRHDHDSLRLTVLDSTDPGAVLAVSERLNPGRTLFIVATKSGGTVETMSLFKYFYNRTAEAVGSENAGRHFVAITDPGSPLVEIAHKYNFRDTFLNDPDIGGRYSVLSFFGLVPAALAGVDIDRVLASARTMLQNNESCNCPIDGDNLAGRLGVIMGVLAKNQRDKLTLITSPGLANFGDWVEQLVAESTGKQGKGILPVVGERVGPSHVYGQDRLFVYLRLEGDQTYDGAVDALAASGHPVATLRLKDRYDLGAQFYLWEMATAVAGHLLQINPFNQPNVEAAKVLARKMFKMYTEEGSLPADGNSPLEAEVLADFLEGATAGDYIAVQAYLQPLAETESALNRFREMLRDHTRLAATLGYGPRFLHSTGQLHKGDAGNGLFIQFTAAIEQDVPIPDEAGRADSSISFGVLKDAQALGDAQALREAGRRLIRFRLDGDVAGLLSRLVDEYGRRLLAAGRK